MYGAWGAATASTGKTFQLRALDWDIDGPFKNYAAVVVYHPSGNSSGHAFANVGFVGWIGALSGQSSAQMAISEIGVYFSDASFGNESRSGIPFTFLLRDILQVCQDLSCALVFAVGLIILGLPCIWFTSRASKGFVVPVLFLVDSLGWLSYTWRSHVACHPGVHCYNRFLCCLRSLTIRTWTQSRASRLRTARVT